MIDFKIKDSNLEKEIIENKNLIEQAHDSLWNKKGIGNEMLGWLDFPDNFNLNEVNEINEKVKKIKNLGIDTLLVIGIGGSYLGSKAAIDFLKGSLNIDEKIYFAGINVSDSYIKQLENKLKNKNWAICVISKSGTTLEPAISFRYFKNLLLKKVGETKLKDLIVVVTDKEKGILKNLADIKGYQTFSIPDDIGGRFSVLTAVGLFPMSFAGIDILKFLEGTKKARKEFSNNDIKNNLAYKYALGRFLLFSKRKKVLEIFTTYDPDFMMLSEWLKQLFAESEGKNNKGIFPTSVTYSRDLHSLGQFIQDGNKVFFETTLFLLEDKKVFLNNDVENLDKLNYLNKKSFAEINRVILNSVIESHANNAKIPNFLIFINERNEETLGYLLFFFFISVSISGYLLRINPFDQPGVEIYKKNMFTSLGKIS
ncbi:MAG: glucose-6-phosphate isomerase [Candidatus Hepatoplasma vulgare]|nr:MAG: glucose-6-phosphate isomerase [Candidatus Hepatoplasma sp.]